MIRRIYYSLPLSLRKLARRIIFIPSDIKYYLTAPKDAMHPPKGKILIGSGDFIVLGEHQLELLKKYLDVRADHHVLDIGCGQGRTAVALTKYLTGEGSYHGIDIMPDAINWCQQRIQSKHPHFNFHLIQLENHLYQNSKIDQKAITLGFNDLQFDKCFLFSVFTHLTQEFVSQYLMEISRILKQGENCLCTMFIYDQSSETHLTNENKGLKFPYEKGGYRIMSDQIEEANVAYSKNLLLEMIAQSELILTQYVEGYWKDWIDKSNENSFQDIIIIKKL